MLIRKGATGSVRPCLSARGFTIVELIVALAIIFVLITTAAVALRSVRQSAERAGTLNSLRQLTQAYLNYAAEHGGRLMPGYVAAADFGTGTGKIELRGRLKTGYDLVNEDKSSYVWRLAPYLDHAWETYMDDYRDRVVLSRLSMLYGKGDNNGAYGPGSTDSGGTYPPEFNIAEAPAFGLNSIYLGGDSRHGPVPDRAPWKSSERIAITRLSEARSPAKLIVFAPTKRVPGVDIETVSEQMGYCELRPAMCEIDNAAPIINWEIGIDGHEANQAIAAAGLTTPGGLPIDRLGGDSIPTAQLDGSVHVSPIAQLADDRERWLPVPRFD